MNEITFISLDNVLQIHKAVLEHHGGLDGIRDIGMLKSAITMPQQQFGGVLLHEDLASMAAAYMFHLAQNHPFNDGNKRTACVTTLSFLIKNKCTAPPAPKALEETVSSCRFRKNQQNTAY